MTRNGRKMAKIMVESDFLHIRLYLLRKANEISIKLYELLYFVALHIIVGKVTSNRTYEDIVLPELDFCWYCKMKTVFEP